MLSRIAFGMVLILGAGCASYQGRTLVPGQAGEGDVEAVMGPSADRRQMSNGETVRYYSRLHAGRQMFAARFGRDGKLIAIEQRLTEDYVAKLTPGVSTAAEVRDLLGPPDRVLRFPRLDGEVWTYPITWISNSRVLNIDIAPDERVREVLVLDNWEAD